MCDIARRRFAALCVCLHASYAYRRACVCVFLYGFMLVCARVFLCVCEFELNCIKCKNFREEGIFLIICFGVCVRCACVCVCVCVCACLCACMFVGVCV